MKYFKITDKNPPQDILIHTKIDDEHGERNEQIMKLQNNLWFTKDGMYVYYKPTHWAYTTEETSKPCKEELWYCK